MRKGSTKDYSKNWAAAFSKKKAQTKTVKKSAAKSSAADAVTRDAKSKKKK